VGRICRITYISYESFESLERRLGITITTEEEDGYKKKSANTTDEYDLNLYLRQHRYLPADPPSPQCYENWQLTFAVTASGNTSNITENEEVHYTSSFRRRVCSKEECGRCKDSKFWGPDTKPLLGLDIQVGDLVECWSASSISSLDRDFGDCHEGFDEHNQSDANACYQVIDPVLEFTEDSEYKRSRGLIIAGWSLIGSGLFVLLIAICCGLTAARL
jgi:hypothetical protein